ncbi:MAG: hypothetical protein IJH94_06000 [Clostridia bacterium]|nr:hypothetical protein [Clostridia bacterium]
MKKLLAAILGVGVLTAGLCISAAAEGTVISVGSAVAEPGEEVSVPVTLSGNPGILAMQLGINYNSSLTLKNCEWGDALKGLTRTKSGNYTVNPYNLIYDAESEVDSTNGTLATLTFTLPADASGSYTLTPTIKKVVNGDLEPVAISLTPGTITVQGNKVSVVEKSGGRSTRTRTDETTDKVYSYTISVPNGISITSDDINVTIGGVVAKKRDGFAEKIGTLSGGDAQFTAAITKIPKGTDLSDVECSVSISYILDGKEVTETTDFTLE